MGRTSIDAAGQRVSWLNVYRRPNDTLEIGNLFPEKFWIRYAYSGDGHPHHLRIKVKWKPGHGLHI